MKKVLFIGIGVGLGIIILALGLFFLANKLYSNERDFTKQALYLPNGEKYHFWLYEPKNNLASKKPLLIYFAGLASRKDLDSVSDYAYPEFVRDGMDFPFYMIAPFVNSSDDFDTDSRVEKTKILIDYIVKNYPIDKDRIIVSGGSAGARGAYKMAATYKDLFSCMVIGSGVSKMDDANLTHLPIWFLHGEKDNVIYYKNIESHVNNINALGGNAKLTIIPNEGHSVTETVLYRQDVIDWMVSQKR